MPLEQCYTDTHVIINKGLQILDDHESGLNIAAWIVRSNYYEVRQKLKRLEHLSTDLNKSKMSDEAWLEIQCYIKSARQCHKKHSLRMPELDSY